MKRSHDRMEQEEDFSDIAEGATGPFFASPYTLYINNNLLQQAFEHTKVEFYSPYKDLEVFPWLLQDLGKDFSEEKCQMVYFNKRIKDPQEKKDAMVLYMNRWFCHIQDENGLDKILKKSWDNQTQSFRLVEKTNLEQHLKACAVHSYKVLTDGETGEMSWAKDKPLSPATVWLSSQLRRRYKRRLFAPDDFDRLFHMMSQEDLEGLSDVNNDYLNKFTGWALDPRVCKKFVQEYYREESAKNIWKETMNIHNHHGWCVPYFVDSSSPDWVKETYPLGTMLTGHMVYSDHEDPSMIQLKGCYHYIPGPPHPDNVEFWPEHLEILLRLAETVPQARYLIGGDPGASLDTKVRHIMLYFGRPGDPWGDCGFGIGPFLEFIYTGICSRDMDLYNYLMSWSAALLQRVGKPLSSSVALFNQRNGGGKSSYLKTLISIIGERWCWTTSEPNDIVGDFTAAAADKVLVFLDEIKFSRAARTQQMSNLKNLLSGSQVRVHRKGIDVEMEKRYLNVCMATNESNFLTASLKERRHCAIKIADDINGKNQYLSAIFNMMRGTGRCFPPINDRKIDEDSVGIGLVHFSAYLGDWDITGWSEWPVPKTPLLFNLQMEGWSTAAKWWYSKLVSGHLFRSPTSFWPEETPNTIEARDLMAAHGAWGINATEEELQRKLQKFSSLSAAFLDSTRNMSARETETFKEMSRELEEARSWNRLWPKDSLYSLYMEETKSLGSYGLLQISQFVKELISVLIFGTSQEAERNKAKLSVMEHRDPEQGDGENRGGYRAPRADVETHISRTTMAQIGVRMRDLGTGRRRMEYYSLPSLEVCRFNFAEALQLTEFPPEVIWENRDDSGRILEPEANEYMSKPWTRYDFLERMTRAQRQSMVEETSKWGRKVRARMHETNPDVNTLGPSSPVVAVDPVDDFLNLSLDEPDLGGPAPATPQEQTL